MNILLSNACNVSCAYCFADAFLGERADREDLRFPDYQRILSFLSRSGARKLQLAGGEPTLHPDFSRFVDYAVVEGFVVTILSNGLFGQRVRDHLHRRRGHFRLLCMNLNEPGFYSTRQWDLIRTNLAVLGSKTVIGVNLYRPDQDFEYVIELAREFHVLGLRCVFAHQSGRTSNPVIMSYEDISRQAGRLTDFVQRVGRDLGLRVGYDCGFVPCLFSDEQLGTLSRWNTKLGECSKLAFSVDSGLRVAHCFNREKSEYVAHLDRFSTLSDVEAFFCDLDRTEPPLFEGCGTCAEKRVGACDGGCIADRRILGTIGPRPNFQRSARGANGDLSA